MADLIFTTRDKKIGSIVVDVTTNEKHHLGAKATTHPVEQGSNISDHVILDPVELTIAGVISNHPLKPPAGVDIELKEFKWQTTGPGGLVGSVLPSAGILGTLTTGITGAFGLNEKGAQAQGYAIEFDRMRDSFSEFLGLFEARSPVTIITTLRDYENMILENLDVDQEASNANTLVFTCSAKQITITTTQKADALPDTLKLSGKPKISKGVKPPHDPTDTEKKKTSLLRQAHNKVAGLYADLTD